MNGKNLTEQVLDTIKKKGIKPRPRWEFLLRDCLIWTLSIISLIIGGLAFSVIIHMFKNNDWDVYAYISDSFLGFIFMTLPYFWLLFSVIFILVAHYNLKHTKEGYKYQLHLIVAISIVISVLLGIFLYNIGVGQTLDEVLSARMPFYNRMINRRRMIWTEPEKGLLAGVIVSVDKTGFRIEDWNGKIWNVFGEKTIAMPGIEISTSTRVRIIGEKIDDNKFRAKIIAPSRQPLMNRRFPLHRPRGERNFLDLRTKE